MASARALVGLAESCRASISTEPPHRCPEHRRDDEPVGRPNGNEVRATERTVEPDECGNHAEAFVGVFEHANRDTEVDVAVVKAEPP